MTSTAMKQFLLLVFLLFLSGSLSAQTYQVAQVSNVVAYQEGKNIIITFDAEKEASLFYVYYSTDGKNGKFNLISSSLSKEKISATKYKYTWNVLENFDNFIYDNVVFKVDAYKYRTQQSYSSSSTTKSYSSNTQKSSSPKHTKNWQSHHIYMSFGGFYSLNSDWGIHTKLGYKGVYIGHKTNSLQPNHDQHIEINRFSFLVGYNWFWEKRFSIYTGFGYGKRDYLWGIGGSFSKEKIDVNSKKGLELEGGLNFMFSPNVGVTLGYSTLQFVYSDFSTGLIVKF